MYQGKSKMMVLSCVVVSAARLLGSPGRTGRLLWVTGSAGAANRSHHHVGVLEEILVACRGFMERP